MGGKILSQLENDHLCFSSTDIGFLELAFKGVLSLAYAGVKFCWGGD